MSDLTLFGASLSESERDCICGSVCMFAAIYRVCDKSCLVRWQVSKSVCCLLRLAQARPTMINHHTSVYLVDA